METTGSNRIVAGVDGSTSAINAAVWAAGEAVRRNATLRLVHSFVVPVRGYPRFVAVASEVRDGMRVHGGQSLREATDKVTAAFGDVRLETELREGAPVRVLLEESENAVLTVIGSRGLGGFTGMLVGSTATALAAHGQCPVVVVRGRMPDDPPPETGTVLVGVDGSPASEAAVAFAFAEASAREVPLVALHTWNDTMFEGTATLYPLTVDLAKIDEDEHRVLAEQLAGWQEKYPDVHVERIVNRGRPVRSMLEHGDRAQLIVVGSRGRGGFSGMLMGSTSQALLSHSACPVAVVRPPGVG